MTLIRSLLMLTACGVVGLSSAHAQTFYKCKNGSHVQYAAAPMANHQCMVVSVDGRVPRSASPTRPSTPPATAATPAVSSNLPKVETKVNPPSAQECQQLDQLIATLSTGRKVYQTDEKGEREYMDDTQRQAQLKKYQDMKATCSQ